MEQSRMKVAYVITERGDRSFWNRIGVAFLNRDGSINVKLDALPLSGMLQIRDYEPKEESEGDAPARTARPSALRPIEEQTI